MKIYLHVGLEGFTNSYVVVKEQTNEALIIDIEKVTKMLISQIEDKRLKICAVLITHNHKKHVSGLKTLRKIYNFKTYAADYEIEGEESMILKGDGLIRLAGMNINYFSLPGHSSDSIIYKIGGTLFTGDALSNGMIGKTTSIYARQMLIRNLNEKVMSQSDNTALLPGHGPPTTVGAERKYNQDLNPKAELNMK